MRYGLRPVASGGFSSDVAAAMTPRYSFDTLLTSDVLASLALILSLLAVRLLVGRALKAKENLPPQVVRRWTANVRNFLLLVAVLGLVMIWAPQLRTFALSLTAVAVALVVATKELILCLSGSALRTFTRAYSVGDYVQIGGTRGEVLDYNLLATRIVEFESREGSFVPGGREAIVPHSMLFGSPTRIEGKAGGRVEHTLQLTFEPDVNLFAHGEEIRRAARDAQLDREEKHGKAAPRSKRTSARPEQVAGPEIAFGTSDIGKYRVVVTLFALPEIVAETESAVACAIADWRHRILETQQA
jgi:small-conductance mechanosensitive channel